MKHSYLSTVNATRQSQSNDAQANVAEYSPVCASTVRSVWSETLMSQQRAIARRRLLCIIGLGFVAITMLFAACDFFRITHPTDLRTYWLMSQECPPIWKEFAFRQIREGDPVEDFLHQHPPSLYDEFGPYGLYYYFPPGAGDLAMTGISVSARDGRLVSAEAHSCTWDFQFFGAEEPEMMRQYAEFLRKRYENAQAGTAAE